MPGFASTSGTLRAAHACCRARLHASGVEPPSLPGLGIGTIAAGNAHAHQQRHAQQVPQVQKPAEFQLAPRQRSAGVASEVHLQQDCPQVDAGADQGVGKVQRGEVGCPAGQVFAPGLIDAHDIRAFGIELLKTADDPGHQPQPFFL